MSTRPHPRKEARNKLNFSYSASNAANSYLTNEVAFKKFLLEEQQKMAERNQRNYKNIQATMETMSETFVKELQEVIKTFATKQEANGLLNQEIVEKDEKQQSSKEVHLSTHDLNESTSLLRDMQKDISAYNACNHENFLTFTQEIKQCNENLLKQIQESLKGACVCIIDNLKYKNDDELSVTNILSNEQLVKNLIMTTQEETRQLKDENHSMLRHVINDVIHVQESITNVCHDINRTLSKINERVKTTGVPLARELDQSKDVIRMNLHHGVEVKASAHVTLTNGNDVDDMSHLHPTTLSVEADARHGILEEHKERYEDEIVDEARGKEENLHFLSSERAADVQEKEVEATDEIKKEICDGLEDNLRNENENDEQMKSIAMAIDHMQVKGSLSNVSDNEPVDEWRLAMDDLKLRHRSSNFVSMEEE